MLHLLSTLKDRTWNYSKYAFEIPVKVSQRAISNQGPLRHATISEKEREREREREGGREGGRFSRGDNQKAKMKLSISLRRIKKERKRICLCVYVSPLRYNRLVLLQTNYHINSTTAA